MTNAIQKAFDELNASGKFNTQIDLVMTPAMRETLMNSASYWASSKPLPHRRFTREDEITRIIDATVYEIENLKGMNCDVDVITTPEDHTFAKVAGHKLISISNGVSLVVRDKGEK